MTTLTLPKRLTVSESDAVAQAAERLATDAAIDVMDAGECTMIGPLGAAMLAAAIARRPTRIANIIPPSDVQAAAFCREVGLLDVLRSSGAAAPDDTLHIRNLFANDPVYTHRLAELLVESVEGMTEDAAHLVQLCLNETLQNVFEHAHSDEGCFILARYYVKNGNVRIAVVDSGIGIASAMRTIPGNAAQPAADLVRAALTVEGATSRANGVGGLGLKTIRSLVTLRAGHLTVISAKTRLRARAADIWVESSYAWQGTAIEMDFRPGMYVQAGEEFF